MTEAVEMPLFQVLRVQAFAEVSVSQRTRRAVCSRPLSGTLARARCRFDEGSRSKGRPEDFVAASNRSRRRAPA